MHPLIILGVVVQIYCIIHAIRNQNNNWIFILLMAPGIGAAAYALSHIAPDLFGSYGVRKATRNVMKKLDPNRDLRVLDKNLARSDSIDNRVKVANETLELGDFTRAEQLYRDALTGLYERDPYIMFGLARAQFGQSQFQLAKETLESLIAHNPDFKSPEGHLLFARCLIELNELELAGREFEVLKNNFSGEEARFRYAELLARMGRSAKAKDVIAELKQRVGVAPAHYQKVQREWLQKAQVLEKSLGTD
jgi:hypothetical protein